MTRAARDNGVASVAKALALIDLVGEHGPLALTDLVTMTGQPKSTLFRLLSTICSAGYLERNSRGEYAPAVKLWRLGARAIDYDAIHLAVIGALRGLAEQTSETAHFSIYESGYAVYVDKVEGTHPIHAYTHVGGRSPAWASATGKALLAFQPLEEIARVARVATGFTAATVFESEALFTEMATIRQQGISINRGEWREGVWGVAAAIFGHQHQVVGAIGVSGPQDRIEPALDRLSALVRQRAAMLTERHGGGGTALATLASTTY